MPWVRVSELGLALGVKKIQGKYHSSKHSNALLVVTVVVFDVHPIHCLWSWYLQATHLENS